VLAFQFASIVIFFKLPLVLTFPFLVWLMPVEPPC
jgi:hypothetical protein